MSFYIILLFKLSGRINQSKFFTVFSQKFFRRKEIQSYCIIHLNVVTQASWHRTSYVAGKDLPLPIWSLYVYLINSVFFAVKYMFILEFLFFSVFVRVSLDIANILPTNFLTILQIIIVNPARKSVGLFTVVYLQLSLSVLDRKRG